MNKKVAIAGAGITGLVSAFYLKKAGIDFRIFEKTDRCGGVIQSVSENGFTYETGPNTGTLSNIETTELFEDLSDYFELELADEKAEKRLILKNGKWEELPSGLISGITTPLFTAADKLRLLGEPFRKAGKNPSESVAELVIRRMGKSFLDYAVDPFVSGIYAGDPYYLVTKYALPKLYDLEQKYGSFIGGAIKKAREPKSEAEKKVTKKIFSAKGGLSEIINAIVKNTGKENIKFNADTEIQKKGNLFIIDDEEYTDVISTVNAGELPGLFPFLDKKILDDITSVKYAEVAEIAAGFNKWEGISLDAFGGLIPSKENKNVLGILFMSTLFSGRAPEEGALLTFFAGGTKKMHLARMSEEELLSILKPELADLLGLSDFKPDLLKIFYHKKAIAQYGADSKKRTDAVKHLQNEHKGLFLGGSIIDGVGMADRIKQAKKIVSKISE